MSITPATAADLGRVRRLFAAARHTYVDFADEDLAALLEGGACALGADNSPDSSVGRAPARPAGAAWGAALVAAEPRPPSLPPAAANRANLRGLALDWGRSPQRDTPLLVKAALAPLTRRAPRHEVMAYVNESWLLQPLLAAGFLEVERVQFMRLDGLQRGPDFRPARGPAHLRPAQPGELPALAALDAACFAPRWHFAAPDLMALLLGGRLVVAELADQPADQPAHEPSAALVGYAALTMLGERQAQLARIAVHPAARRRGIAAQLLADALEFARQNAVESVMLNTQTHNTASQALYGRLGFRRVGRTVPILSCSVEAAPPLFPTG